MPGAKGVERVCSGPSGTRLPGMSHRKAIRYAVERLKRGGLDAVIAFDVQDFNESTGGEGFRLPDFGRERTFALVIGNSRALWKPFIRALDEDSRLRNAPHPLDSYTEDLVSKLQAETRLVSEAFFAHQPEPRVPIQRVAAAAGLAELSPSHLSVHPVHGPWLGLRAVVVFDCDSFQAAELVARPAGHESHCRGCAAPCVAVLERAVALQPSSADEQGWPVWLAVRDACPVARSHRYGPNQIRYHYTKDPSALVPEPA